MSNKTDRALEGVMRLTHGKDHDIYNQAILLYSDYQLVRKKSNLGLGDFGKDTNRIKLAVLEILSTIEDFSSATPYPDRDTGTQFVVQEKILQLEDKIELILAIVEKLQESVLSRFIRSNVFKLLRQNTQNRLMSLSSSETESDDFNFLIGECYDTLESEFLHSIFDPLKKEILNENDNIEKREILSKLEGDQKLELYEFIIDKRDRLTTRQMANLLADNLNKKYNTKTKKYNYVFYFMLRKYRIIDRWQLEKELKLLVEERIDKKLSNILYSRLDYERIRDLMLKIFQAMQLKENEQEMHTT